MAASSIAWLAALPALLVIAAGTAYFVNGIGAAENGLRVRSGAIALILPLFGPSGAAAIEALQPHHSLRDISVGFSAASTITLVIAGCWSIMLGIKSINARIFQYFLFAVPIPIAIMFVLADSRVSRFEGAALMIVYAVFVTAIWWVERLEPSKLPVRSNLRSLAAPALSIVVVIAGSVILIAIARMATDAHKRNTAAWIAGAGIAVQVLTILWVSIRNQRSEVAVAGVVGTLAFNSAVILGTFGLTTKHHDIDIRAHDLAALATLLVPAVLFAIAFKQTKRMLLAAHREESDTQLDNVFAWRNLKRDLSNYQLLRHRDVDGNLVTGMNSGTHWITVMLATAIAEQHGLALPQYFSFTAAGELVGSPRVLVRRPGIPAIVRSHNHPATPLSWPVVRRMLSMPKQVVLVRDIRDVLISAYVKWKPDITFSEFVRGDPCNHHTYLCDVWWYVSYLNRWGAVKAAAPRDTLVVRYEDMLGDPELWLRRIGDHFGLGLSDRAIEAGLAFRDKDAAHAKRDPNDTERVIADPAAKADVRFSDGDMRVLRAILARHLKYDFGYDYGLKGVRLVPIEDAVAPQSLAS